MKNPNDIKQLKHDSRNPRKRTQRNLSVIEKSLSEIGAARSIVIDENNEILTGNGVVEVAGQMGIHKVQVVDADGQTIVAVRRTGLTEEQKRRYKILDNRAGELAEWDDDLMREEYDDGLLEGLFSDAELEKLVHLSDPDAKRAKQKEDAHHGVIFIMDNFTILLPFEELADKVLQILQDSTDKLTLIENWMKGLVDAHS